MKLTKEEFKKQIMEKVESYQATGRRQFDVKEIFERFPIVYAVWPQPGVGTEIAALKGADNPDPPDSKQLWTAIPCESVEEAAAFVRAYQTGWGMH